MVFCLGFVVWMLVCLVGCMLIWFELGSLVYACGWLLVLMVIYVIPWFRFVCSVFDSLVGWVWVVYLGVV